MNEQPEQKRTDFTNIIAFGVGLLLAFLTANYLLSLLGPDSRDTSFPIWSAWAYFPIPYLWIYLFPLLLGVVGALTVIRRTAHLVTSAQGRSLLAWLGMYSYWFFLALSQETRWTQEAQASCQSVNYHGWCGLHAGSTGLFIYFLYGVLLILFSASLTALLIKLTK